MLLPVRGIGPWSVDMFLMFALVRPDVLPSATFGDPAKGMPRHFQLRKLPEGRSDDEARRALADLIERRRPGICGGCSNLNTLLRGACMGETTPLPSGAADGFAAFRSPPGTATGRCDRLKQGEVTRVDLRDSRRDRAHR